MTLVRKIVRAAQWLAILASAIVAMPALAQGNDVQTSWRLLDYLAVDYSGAVAGGKVVSPSEYAEMREFSASVAEKLAGLPDKPQKPGLVAAAARLRAAIDRKAPAEQVAALAHGLGADLLRVYPVAMAPTAVPDVARGARLYASTCASCHGVTGKANTDAARALDPPPIAFADKARADQRSPFALYQVVTQGLNGTAMVSFSNLSDRDRLALAYYAGTLAYDAKLAARGKGLWENDAAVRAAIPDLQTLTGLSADALGAKIGKDKADAVLAYLRLHPDALTGTVSVLPVARARLAASLAAYRAGNAAEAKQLALSAYLDGFEPVEPTLAARNPALLAQVEKQMGELRAAIGSNASADIVAAKVGAIEESLTPVESELSARRGDSVSTFVGALTILLREGVEALLIVVAMLAFLRKGDRAEMTRPVHYGWISALIGGILTWWAATELITVSGATRELTEGFGSVLAAAVLLFVGIWMHGKAQAGEWQRYIREKLSDAVTSGSAWFLFLLAFIAVYREIFETILFYIALAAEGNIGALVAGALTGAVLLAAIAVAMLKFSQRLPIGKFFAYSSALVAILAVVLAGKGVAGLQEAGLIGTTPIDGPRITWLGIFPTLQGILAQIVVLTILLAGFAWNRRKARNAALAIA
ncbi:MAG: cytochrome c/FTR1 family iron permease [Pseudomonadota bacterium]